MSFPACKHRRRAAPPENVFRWLASEPYRILFALGTLWSIIGVMLWPLFYHGLLRGYPLFPHTRLMIEGFGGAFVLGFLGTAGPRMASAPKLTPLELCWLTGLHSAACVLHLMGKHPAGDVLFTAVLLSLVASLFVRVFRFRKEALPPQLLLGFSGLFCGIAGAGILAISGGSAPDPLMYRLASLLLYQGLLLPPVLGIGSFVFPRILGGDFGESATAAETRKKRWRSMVSAVLLCSSFVLEAYGFPLAGGLLRAAVCAFYLLLEVGWAAKPGQGSLAAGLRWALVIGLAGIVLAAFAGPGARVSVNHLLYIAGFGLLMLIVGSRVLFGHSGGLAMFSERSWTARSIIWLALLAAATRAVPALVPALAVSHHNYAAITWAVLASIWLFWHRRRFLQREEK